MTQQLDREKVADPWAAPASSQATGPHFDIEAARLKISSRTTIAVAFIAVSSVLNLIFSVPGLDLYLLPDENEANIALVLMQLLPVAGLVIGALGAVITFLMWIHRASVNLRGINPGQIFEFTPGWCVGWWFIPIANLWKPFQAMQEIWSFSRINAEYSARLRTPSVLGMWWAFWIGAVILDRIASKASEEVGTLDLVAASVRAGAGIFCILVMRNICTTQLDSLKHLASRGDVVR